ARKSLLFRVPLRSEFRITCLDSRSWAKPNLSAARRGGRASNIPKLRPSARSKKGERSEPFAESARTEHRSGGEAAAKERSGYLLLCAVARLIHSGGVIPSSA